ncbi:acylphosphatase [Thiococcus pfennigii]|uniref:acylphosphatase n=2 Tax=Thiococcus pfennigii TaxID=1057 RepID=UPI001904417E|nr:acylphosphatase [Thiococcus pfennigii]MBK1732604.1 acylphosphatase [Thiococcus pfennigii]
MHHDDPGNAPRSGKETAAPLCLRCLVAGRVQGVAFRASARAQALRLGVAGHARNLADGRVEVLACGPAAALAELRRWLARGPSRAEVEEVTCESLPYRALSGFDTR